MSPAAVDFHPAARDELLAAHAWYRARNESSALAFVREMERAIEVIAEAPDRWPSYLHGTRRYLLRRFPFSVVYRRVDAGVQVVAVAHARRRPGYWRAR